ncbi:hypothetical protein FRC10_001430 [Ceratobasidium sp. 414]|nr:hypothetical protein FRC10_001430 [Ceratobasidium sp. 414]
MDIKQEELDVPIMRSHSGIQTDNPNIFRALERHDFSRLTSEDHKELAGLLIERTRLESLERAAALRRIRARGKRREPIELVTLAYQVSSRKRLCAGGQAYQGGSGSGYAPHQISNSAPRREKDESRAPQQQ